MKPGWRRGVAAAVVLVAGITAVALRLPHPPGPAAAPTTYRPAPASWQRLAVPATALADSVGVRITRVSISGDGGLLDLRYQVVDPTKAHALHEPGTPPAVVDEATGLVINELFMGHRHTGQFRASAIYYLVFVNPGGWVHRGSRVTVLLGNAQVEHVAVA
jgi:hypothetical protein